jgi:hypothetical protein
MSQVLFYRMNIDLYFVKIPPWYFSWIAKLLSQKYANWKTSFHINYPTTDVAYANPSSNVRIAAMF